MATLKPVKQKNRGKSGHHPFSHLTLLQHVEWFTPALTLFPTCSDFWLDFPPVVRMACEIKLLESEATTGFFVLPGEQGNKAVLGWVMKEGLIPSRYECQKCKKDMLLVERKGTIDGLEWRCRVQSKENPHFVCRSSHWIYSSVGRSQYSSSQAGHFITPSFEIDTTAQFGLDFIDLGL
ncbi:hypothetical protein TNCV_4483851 [Trichonephila clavipes]|nr:hypothetical protein TNCV_4483851 [Trichonephila clavipes]